LADDSVLERLNSVLEPHRTLVLAERGGGEVDDQIIVASSEFKLVATMNPGGDYGKKELSPALRNRFTEIWVPPISDRVDLEQIADSLWKYEALRPWTAKLLDFVQWLIEQVHDPSICGIRDLLVSTKSSHGHGVTDHYFSPGCSSRTRCTVLSQMHSARTTSS
jgi:midasin